MSRCQTTTSWFLGLLLLFVASGCTRAPQRDEVVGHFNHQGMYVVEGMPAVLHHHSAPSASHSPEFSPANASFGDLAQLMNPRD